MASTAIAFLFCLLFLVAKNSGAWHKDFVADPDEPAHAVSSLMIRDYIAAGFPENPLRFAEAYYVHYPKVAIGHWPPLFHASEALWMLVFGRNRAAMVSFPAALDFALLAGVFLWMKRDAGMLPALLSAAILLVAPFMQTASWSVSPNMLLALLAFCAAAVYGKFLETRRRGCLALFGLLVVACACTHGRGIAVALIPLVVWLFDGRARLNAWRIAALLLTLLVLLIVPARLHQVYPPSWSAALHLSWYFFRDLFISMGWPAMLLAIAGTVRSRGVVRWRPMIALPFAAWIFHTLMNIGWEDRFLTIAAAPVACLAGSGMVFVWQWFARHWQSTQSRTGTFALAALASGGIIVWCAMGVRLVEKPDLGYHRISANHARVLLAAGDPRHEGALISEIALRDPKLERVVLRSSKMLFQSTWLGAHYRLQFRDAGEVASWLDRFPVELITVQTTDPDPDIGQLLEALRHSPSSWREAPAVEAPSEARLFQRIGPLPQGAAHIRIDMRNKLGRFLDLDLR